MTNELRPEQRKAMSGILLLIGVCFVAAGLSYIFGAWLGLIIVGVIILLWSREIWKTLQPVTPPTTTPESDNHE
jgi:hypothetical protein